MMSARRSPYDADSGIRNEIHDRQIVRLQLTPVVWGGPLPHFAHAFDELLVFLKLVQHPFKRWLDRVVLLHGQSSRRARLRQRRLYLGKSPLGRTEHVLVPGRQLRPTTQTHSVQVSCKRAQSESSVKYEPPIAICALLPARSPPLKGQQGRGESESKPTSRWAVRDRSSLLLRPLRARR